MAKKWAGIALADAIEETIDETLRIYPEAEASDLIYALIRNLANRAAAADLGTSAITAAWQTYNRGKQH